jgi:hypothetical protein
VQGGRIGGQERAQGQAGCSEIWDNHMNYAGYFTQHSLL